MLMILIKKYLRHLNVQIKIILKKKFILILFIGKDNNHNQIMKKMKNRKKIKKDLDQQKIKNAFPLFITQTR